MHNADVVTSLQIGGIKWYLGLEELILNFTITVHPHMGMVNFFEIVTYEGTFFLGHESALYIDHQYDSDSAPSNYIYLINQNANIFVHAHHPFGPMFSKEPKGFSNLLISTLFIRTGNDFFLVSYNSRHMPWTFWLSKAWLMQLSRIIPPLFDLGLRLFYTPIWNYKRRYIP